MEAEQRAEKIVRTLVSNGFKAYYAGGWVRDYVLGHPTSDIDIATEAPPEKVMALFPRTIAVGASFGVVIVVEEGYAFEVSSFRRDGLYIDGRRPETVEYATPEEDASRRDFTINGMFYDPLTKQIFDYVEGCKDLEKRLIKAIGDARQRFKEDRLRMVRGVRLAARFQFEIDPETEKAITEEASNLFPSVAMERVFQELKKMCDYPHFDQALKLMHRLGLLKEIFPALNGLGDLAFASRWSPYH